MKIWAHRGASAHELENTIAAFRRARADGADGVELDVLMSADGEVVVFHDDDLARLGGRPDAVAALSARELAAVELRHPKTGRTGRIPTLDAVLEELGPLDVNVELKTAGRVPPRRLAPAVARVLARHAGVRALVSSFNPFALLHFAAVAPRVPRALLFHRDQALPLREAWARFPLRPRALHPQHLLVTEARMARWRGYEVNAWTVDEEEEIRRLRGVGVDGVITNDPRRARGALGF